MFLTFGMWLRVWELDPDRCWWFLQDPRSLSGPWKCAGWQIFQELVEHQVALLPGARSPGVRRSCEALFMILNFYEVRPCANALPGCPCLKQEMEWPLVVLVDNLRGEKAMLNIFENPFRDQSASLSTLDPNQRPHPALDSSQVKQVRHDISDMRKNWKW